MLFTSLTFIFVFLPIMLSIYYLLSFSKVCQNIWLLIGSLLFYVWGGTPEYLPVMLSAVLLNIFSGIVIAKMREKQHSGSAKVIMILAVIADTVFLMMFKYLGFWEENINMLARGEVVSFVELAAPLGLSFFVLRAIAYNVDIYRGKTKPGKNFINIALYFLFFPTTISGPLVSYEDFQTIATSKKWNFRRFTVGACRFVIGLAKKVLIAENMAIVANRVFDLSTIGREGFEVPVLFAWMGIIAFALQIYFDFSGYCDMAIGIAYMLGYKLEENFDYPYAAGSVTEFWRKWNISVSNWFKEYVYFSMGGSHVKTKDKIIRNMFLTWMLVGLWHGADWTFIFWGIWNFLFIFMERFLSFRERTIPMSLRRIYTLFVCLMGWVTFRGKDLYQVGEYYKNMFGMNRNCLFGEVTQIFLHEYWYWFIAAILFAFPIAKAANGWLMEHQNSVITKINYVVYPICLLIIFALSVVYIRQGVNSAFIYFTF